MIVKSIGRGLALLLLLTSTASSASDWSRFRGPNGSGVSPDTKPLPSTWSNKENLQWKVDLPGPGASCPIVVGDKVFVTCWSGYGIDRGRGGDQSKLRRHLIAVDRKTGKILWNKDVAPELPEDQFAGMFAENGYATHTPVSDGEHVFVFFGKTGVFAFDTSGKQLWQTKVGNGSDSRGWGSASSPILHKNLVIVTASAECNSVVALDKLTGKQVWKQEAEGVSGTWGTPILVPVEGDRIDLVLGVPYEIWGLNPETGKLRWFCPAMDTNTYCSSVVTAGGIIYGIEGRGGGSIAVKAGGSGDISKSNIVWQGRDNNRIGTPVALDGRLYFVNNRIVNCINAADGKKIYQARLSGEAGRADNGDGREVAPREERGPRDGAGGPPGGGRGGRQGGMGGGQDYSSPVAADGKLFYLTRRGECHVIKLGDKFDSLGVNRLSEEAEDYTSSPSISDGQIFIRSSRRLYCISPSPLQASVEAGR